MTAAPLAVLLPCLCLWVTASAQEPVPAAPVPAAAAQPAGPAMLVQALGPAAWRQQFLPTNLGNLLASKEGEALWRPFERQFEERWQGLNRDADHLAARARMLDYGGVITLVTWLEGGQVDEPLPYGVVSIGPDGRTDLEALAGDVGRALERGLALTWQAQQIGDRKLDVAEQGKERITRPIVVGDTVRFYFAIGGELPDALNRGDAWLAAQATETDAKARLNMPALRYRIDLAQYVARMAARDREFADICGLRALEQIEFTVGASGPNVMLTAGLTRNRQPADLLQFLLPDNQPAPRLFAALPPHASPWHCSSHDVAALERFIVHVARTVEPDKTEADFRKDAEQEMGMPLGDLLSGFTGEMLITGDLLQNAGDEDGVPLVMAYGVRDAAKAKAAVEKLCDKSRGMVGVMETEEVPGGHLLRVGGGLFGNAIVVIGDKAVVCAYGGAARDAAIALHDRIRNLPAELPAGSPADAEARRWQPPQATARCTIELTLLLKRQLRLLHEAIEQVAFGAFQFDARPMLETLEGAVPLLEQYQLKHVRTFSGCKDGHWTVRILL